MRTPFLGGHSVARSTNLVDNQLINLYPELVDTKDGKDIGAFFMCPGLDLMATVGTGPIRGLHVMANALYVVSGGSLYSVTPGWSSALLGSVAGTSGAVSMIDNGSQLLMVGGNAASIVSGGVLSSVTLPFSNPTGAAYQDTFGFTVQSGSQIVWQSNVGDLSTWNALNFSSADGQGDNVVALADIHRELWVMKQRTIEVWVDAGLSGFSFQRLDGVFIEAGCAAPATVAKVGETLVWLSQNDQGGPVVLQAQGYKTSKISSRTMDRIFAGYQNTYGVSDAIAYCYQQEGHVFYVITFPAANASWACDMTTMLWHQRAAFSNGAFNRHWGNAYAYFNGLPIVGDYQSGKLFAFDLDTYTDNGTQRKWLRSWRALPKPTDQTVSFRSLRIDMQTGVAPNGTNPQCVLRWSDDGGNNWSNSNIASVGPPGATAQRVMFRRLGQTRRSSGLDRIFELSSTDPFKVSLMGAELDAA